MAGGLGSVNNQRFGGFCALKRHLPRCKYPPMDGIGSHLRLASAVL
ncbi:hypothetical protein HMPREF9123_0763 [Neisseria bacilliformis ATCC BAA-1200]|uniref:Uncharacterized protein n=1 Tax=Neisseria bacilliformis ATCC BAA-1200 TaxID=888742 RepID=F2BAN2_9NEIS|nr:hypothetical protein HMPREF9123_0763 [Neisseria bacilliformis ATCC BAA-1200]